MVASNENGPSRHHAFATSGDPQDFLGGGSLWNALERDVRDDAPTSSPSGSAGAHRQSRAGRDPRLSACIIERAVRRRWRRAQAARLVSQ